MPAATARVVGQHSDDQAPRTVLPALAAARVPVDPAMALAAWCGRCGLRREVTHARCAELPGLKGLARSAKHRPPPSPASRTDVSRGCR